MTQAADLEICVPVGDASPELAYVAESFFVGLETVRIREYVRAPERCSDVPRIILHRGEPPARADSRGEVWIFRGRGWDVRAAEDLGATLRDVARAPTPPGLSHDLFALLFQLYSLRGLLPADGGYRQKEDAPFARHGIATDPCADEIRESLLARLGIAVPPHRRGGMLALTHDVDQIDTHSLASIRYWLSNHPRAPHGAFHRWRPYVTFNARHLVEVARRRRTSRTALVEWYLAERERGLRSTFYVMEDRASREDLRNGWYSYGDPIEVDGHRMTVGGLLGRLAREGFEVGPHIGLHAYASRSGYARSVAGVRELVGPVATTRHHWCMIEPHLTLALMEAEGIGCDLNLGGVGFPFGTAMPFRLYHHVERRPARVLAIPTVIMDDLLLKPANSGLTPDRAWQVATDVVRRVGEVGGIAALSFHASDYRGIDKLRFYLALVEAAQSSGLGLGTAAEAGALAASRFPRVICDGAPADGLVGGPVGARVQDH